MDHSWVYFTSVSSNLNTCMANQSIKRVDDTRAFNQPFTTKTGDIT